MKRVCLAALAVSLAAPAAFAQDHYTEGPVWECSSYRTKQGHFEDYMEYLRQNVLPQNAEQKKAGLVMEHKMYLHTPASPNDPDVVFCTLHANFGKALDYNAEDDKKGKDIATKHYKTADEKKQREMTANRFAFRDYLGTSYYREITLKPMP